MYIFIRKRKTNINNYKYGNNKCRRKLGYKTPVKGSLPLLCFLMLSIKNMDFLKKIDESKLPFN